MADSNQKAPDEALPPVLFPAANSTGRRRLAALKAEGRIRLVGPRLYVSTTEPDAAAAVRRSWSTVVANLFPGALISHRSALEFNPTPNGEIFITGSSNRAVEYPGLILKFVRGPKALDDDPKFLACRSSSFPRALLENLNSRTPARALPAEQLESRLEQTLHLNGEEAINLVRDRAKEIAREFGWASELERLDGLIGALLGTRKARVKSAVAKARIAGEPFDAKCLERLQILFAELRTPSAPIADDFANAPHFKNKAFFESYFSNYIEGTEFEVSEAEAIVFEGKIPPMRPKDAHDVLGTFEIVSDLGEMKRAPQSFDEFMATLTKRHARMMGRRPEAGPGTLKSEPNRAGETRFVHPDYVVGTLRKGWELSDDLPRGLARAIFIGFLVSDVHPFVDGNGRTSRIMLNSELVAADQSTVIIPTVFRDDYIQALRALSRRNRPSAIIEVFVRAQKFSHLDFSDYPAVLGEITKRNWLREPDEARIVEI